MDITIHYIGRLRSESEMQVLNRIITDFAVLHGWVVHEVAEPYGALTHMVDGRTVEYNGPVNGWILEMLEGCEPLFLLFDRDGRTRHSCTTRFASAEVHMGIIHLLEALAPSFAELDVTDEGGYWETRDARLLRTRFEPTHHGSAPSAPGGEGMRLTAAPQGFELN
jgi:hypothetical protein